MGLVEKDPEVSQKNYLLGEVFTESIHLQRKDDTN